MTLGVKQLRELQLRELQYDSGSRAAPGAVTSHTAPGAVQLWELRNKYGSGSRTALGAAKQIAQLRSNTTPGVVRLREP